MIKSIRTSELYVIGFVLLVWAADRLGIDVGQILAVLLDLRTTAADVARELQGIEEPKGTAGYWLAAAWLAARTALKARGPVENGAAAGGQVPRRDPYQAWRDSPANHGGTTTAPPPAGRGPVPDKPSPAPEPAVGHHGG